MILSNVHTTCCTIKLMRANENHVRLLMRKNELETRLANITNRGGPLIMGCKTPLPMFSLRRQQVFDSYAETRVGRTSREIEFLPVDHERQTAGDICHVKNNGFAQIL